MLTEDELREAFHQFKDAVFGYAWRMTNSVPSAEDIAQDVFLTLWRDRTRFERGRGELRSFLLGITRNICLKRLRDSKRWAELPEDLVSAAVHIDMFDPEAALAAAVQELPPLQREVLILATYEALPIAEIANLVNADPGTVKARLHRARENLKLMLAPLKASLTGSSNGTAK